MNLGSLPAGHPRKGSMLDFWEVHQLLPFLTSWSPKWKALKRSLKTPKKVTKRKNLDMVYLPTWMVDFYGRWRANIQVLWIRRWKRVPTPSPQCHVSPLEIAGLINRGGNTGGYIILSGKISRNYSTMVVHSLNKAPYFHLEDHPD